MKHLMEKDFFSQIYLLRVFFCRQFSLRGEKQMAECFSSNKMDLGSYFWSMDLSVKFDGTCTVEKGEKGGHHVSKKV